MNPQQKIIKNLETRFKTIMIGSIARFENTFGYLWNHGKNPENKNQENFANQWEDLRINLLNHGNNQIRGAISDLEDFLVEQDKYSYSYKFLFNKKNRR